MTQPTNQIVALYRSIATNDATTLATIQSHDDHASVQAIRLGPDFGRRAGEVVISLEVAGVNIHLSSADAKAVADMMLDAITEGCPS